MKCSVSDSRLRRVNLTLPILTSVSRLLLRLTQKCCIFLISQLHPAVNFCNLEARDLFCKCCLPDDCVGTEEALADKVEEHMAPIWIQIGGHSVVIQKRCPYIVSWKSMIRGVYKRHLNFPPHPSPHPLSTVVLSAWIIGIQRPRLTALFVKMASVRNY